jgi:hypothetical protein
VSRRHDPPPAEPLELGGLLERAWSLYRAWPAVFILVTLVAVVPQNAVQVASDLAWGSGDAGGSGRAFAGVAEQIVLAILVLPISIAAATVASIDAVDGRVPSTRRSLAAVGARFWILIGALAISTLVIAVAFVAIIPGVYLLILWLFVAPVVVVEGLGVRAALARSAELVRGGWWRVFAAFLLIRVLAGLLEALAVTPVARGVSGLSYAPEVLVGGAWRTVVQALIEPFALVALALLYLDRRVRLEGEWPEPVTPARARLEPPLSA